uniref:hypothetical protein n=1 Tax=Bacteroides stercoris TaxID=46506 RepID=UPI0034A1E3E5
KGHYTYPMVAQFSTGILAHFSISIYIPDADGMAVLYNDGKIRFDEIADIEVGSVFVGILLRNGYLFYLSRTEPLKTCIYTHGGWGSISEISPRGIAGHIGRELHGKLGDHTAVD